MDTATIDVADIVPEATAADEVPSWPACTCATDGAAVPDVTTTKYTVLGSSSSTSSVMRKSPTFTARFVTKLGGEVSDSVCTFMEVGTSCALAGDSSSRASKYTSYEVLAARPEVTVADAFTLAVVTWMVPCARPDDPAMTWAAFGVEAPSASTKYTTVPGSFSCTSMVNAKSWMAEAAGKLSTKDGGVASAAVVTSMTVAANMRLGVVSSSRATA